MCLNTIFKAFLMILPQKHINNEHVRANFFEAHYLKNFEIISKSPLFPEKTKKKLKEIPNIELEFSEKTIPNI